MHKHKGVALFEMILSLLLFAILSGAIVELFAHPMQDYLWQMRALSKLDDMKACLNILNRDITNADKALVEKTADGDRLVLNSREGSIEYIFSNHSHRIERKSPSALQTLLSNTHSKLMAFSNAQSKGLVITLQTIEKDKVKLAMPVLLPGE